MYDSLSTSLLPSYVSAIIPAALEQTYGYCHD
jgi:hypothetical protein